MMDSATDKILAARAKLRELAKARLRDLGVQNARLAPYRHQLQLLLDQLRSITELPSLLRACGVPESMIEHDVAAATQEEIILAIGDVLAEAMPPVAVASVPGEHPSNRE